MSEDIVLDGAQALLIEAIETHHYRVVQEWDEDGGWYRMCRKGSAPADGERYRLADMIPLLLDCETAAFMEEVSAAEAGEQQPEGDGVLW